MMVLVGYFLFAAIAGIAPSAIIGLVLTNLMVGRFEKADRPIKLSYKSGINEEAGTRKVA